MTRLIFNWTDFRKFSSLLSGWHLRSMLFYSGLTVLGTTLFLLPALRAENSVSLSSSTFQLKGEGGISFRASSSFKPAVSPSIACCVKRIRVDRELLHENPMWIVTFPVYKLDIDADHELRLVLSLSSWEMWTLKLIERFISVIHELNKFYDLLLMGKTFQHIVVAHTHHVNTSGK